MPPRAVTEFPPFHGFDAGTFAWFTALAADNSSAFFTQTRDTWEAQVRDPLTGLLGELAAEYGGRVRLFRQHRDVRFAGAGRGPIKETTYGVIYERPGTEAGLYVELSARGLFAGTGAYQLATDQLAQYRQRVLDNGSGAALAAEVARLERAGFVVLGDTLRSVPRGMPRDHVRAGLLGRKELLVGRWLPPEAAADRRRRAAAVRNHVRRTWDGAAALNAWFDTHVGPSAIPPEIRWGGGRARGAAAKQGSAAAPRRRGNA